MYYICYMENDNKPFDLENRIAQYNRDIAEVMYDFASDLLDQVADEDVLELYKDNDDIFSKISAKSKDEILENKELLSSAINVMIEYLNNRPLTEEEFNDMTFEDIMNYIAELIEDKKISLFDIIQYLERK